MSYGNDLFLLNTKLIYTKNMYNKTKYSESLNRNIDVQKKSRAIMMKTTGLSREPKM